MRGWLVDNKLSIHFGNDKTKSVLFSTKNKKKRIGTLDIKYGTSYQAILKSKIHRFWTWREPVGRRLLTKSMVGYLSSTEKTDIYCRIWEGSYAIQQFNHISIVAVQLGIQTWTKNLKPNCKKYGTNFLGFCFQLNSRSHIGIKEFEKINWLPVSKRFNKFICSNAHRFFNGNCPLFLYDLYKPKGEDQINKGYSVLKLRHLLSGKCFGQNTLYYLTEKLWNTLTTCLRFSNTLNSFKRGIKNHIFKELSKSKIFFLIKAHQHLSQIAAWYSKMFLLVKMVILFLIFLSFRNWFNY